MPEPEIGPPPEGRCSFYLPLKRRYCRGQVPAGSPFCGTHQPRDRVPCPYNPKHDVARVDLAAHLRRCQDGRVDPRRRPYFRLHCNCVKADPAATGAEVAAVATDSSVRPERPAGFRHHQALSPEELTALGARIQQLYRTFVAPELLGDPLDPLAGEGAEQCGAAAHSGGKELEQHAALASVLEGAGLGEEPCYVEFGAGKGGLSLHLATRWAELHPPSGGDAPPLFVVADRGGFRRKADGKVSNGVLGNAPSGAAVRPFLRLRCDLRDLALRAAFPAHQAHPGPEAEDHDPPAAVEAPAAFAAVGKHLCGACTDYAVTCSLRATALFAADEEVEHRTAAERRAAGEKAPAAGVAFVVPSAMPAALCPPLPLRGAVIATCCHHLCDRAQLTGVLHDTATWSNPRAAERLRALLAELPPAVFEPLSTVTSWAVCGGQGTTAQDTAQGTMQGKRPREEEAEGRVGRAALGRMAKRVIDTVRLLTLRAAGFDASLRHYTSVAVSGENCCIVARPPQPEA